jgi:hypothetical protein
MSVIAFPVLSQLVRRRCNYYLVAFSVSSVRIVILFFKRHHASIRDIISIFVTMAFSCNVCEIC